MGPAIFHQSEWMHCIWKTMPSVQAYLPRLCSCCKKWEVADRMKCWTALTNHKIAAWICTERWCRKRGEMRIDRNCAPGEKWQWRNTCGIMRDEQSRNNHNVPRPKHHQMYLDKFHGRYHNQGVSDYNLMFYIVIELRLCWLKGKLREKSRAMHQETMTISFAGTCKIGILHTARDGRKGQVSQSPKPKMANFWCLIY